MDAPHFQLQELLELLFLVISLPQLMEKMNIYPRTLKMRCIISHKQEILLLLARLVSLNFT